MKFFIFEILFENLQSVQVSSKEVEILNSEDVLENIQIMWRHLE